MAAPPSLVGWFQFAVAVMGPPAVPAWALPMTGAVGAVGARGVTLFDAADSAPRPTALTARTRKLYAGPLVSPVTTVLVAVGANLQ